MAGANVFYNGAELWMSSGASATTFARVDRAQDIKCNVDIPRVQTQVLGKFAPLVDQPVVNYTPVSLSWTYAKGNKDMERNLGLLNTTGAAIQIGQGTTVPDWGARNYQIRNCPVDSTTYAGQWDVVTGVLKSWSLAGSVGDTVKGTVTVEAIDRRQVANVSARSIPTYSGQLIKPENMQLTGLSFAGLGYSGLLVQSFSLQLAFDHAQTFHIGTKYPEKRVTSAAATLSMTAFISGGVTNLETSLTGYDIGSPLEGQYVLTLQPSCGAEPATTITMTRPYLMANSVGIPVGAFTQVDLTLALPLSVVPAEATATNASNVVIT